ncbi:MAG TPA: DUF29 family protein, partial [Stellaceae bacterium]
ESRRGDRELGQERATGTEQSPVHDHLVKLQKSPAPEPRNGWRATVRRERTEIERLLKDNRSLRHQIPRLIKEAIPPAASDVVAELEDRGELDPTIRAGTSSYPELFPYSPDQILGDWFPPEPQG